MYIRYEIIKMSNLIFSNFQTHAEVDVYCEKLRCFNDCKIH